MKRNFSKQDSFLTGSHSRVNKEDVGLGNRSISCRSKDSCLSSSRGTCRSDQSDESKLKKRKCRKKEAYPTGFREVIPSANYDDVKQTVKKNIKIAQKQREPIPSKLKLTKNLNTDLKDTDKLNENQPKIKKFFSLKTDNEMPSCTTVRQNLLSHNQDPLKSPLSDLYFLGDNCKLPYNQETVKLPHVLDNNKSSMKINYKGNDKDIEQLVYFLHEYMGHKYLIESCSKPSTDIEQFSANAKLKNFIFSFLLNLPVKNVSETSLNGIKSAYVQQAVMHTSSSSKTVMTLGEDSKATIPADNNNDDNSLQLSTQSYEVQEIKSSNSGKSELDSGSLDNESLSDKSNESLVKANKSQEHQGGTRSDGQIRCGNKSHSKVDNTEKSSSKINNPEKSSSKLNTPEKSSEDLKSQQESQASIRPEKSKEEQGGTKSDSHIKSPNSNIGGSGTKSSSEIDNSKKSHSKPDNSEKSHSKLDNSEKSQSKLDNSEKSSSKVDHSEQSRSKIDNSEQSRSKLDNSEQSRSKLDNSEKSRSKMDNSESKRQIQDSEEGEEPEKKKSAESQDGGRGEGSSSSTDNDDTSWLKNFQEKVDRFLTKLNFVRGPLINDSVLHGYNYILAVKSSLGEENPNQDK